MGTDRYGEKKTGFDHITLRTNPYKSVQKNAQSALISGGGAKRTILGRLSFAALTCRRARKDCGARLDFSEPEAKERIKHP